MAIVGDGVTANSSRGYVLRRLIRRTLTTLWGDGEYRTLGDLSSGQWLRTFRNALAMTW